MIRNRLEINEEEFFLDIYKTSLAAMLSSKKLDELDCYNINGAIDMAATIAMKSVDLLMDVKTARLKTMNDIINKLSNTRPSDPVDYPDVIE